MVCLEDSGRSGRSRSEYHVDVWRCVRQRWLVGGVLAALALAVLAPAAGAHGGALHAQHAPLSYIYFTAGRRGDRAPSARLLLACCAHAALVAPALCVLLLAGTSRGDVPAALLQGVLISSVGGGCGWLSLALCSEAAAPLAAAAHLSSLLAAPVVSALLVRGRGPPVRGEARRAAVACPRLQCGRATLPAPGAVVGACAAALVPYGAGRAAARWGRGRGGAGAELAARLCALALLYMRCCDALETRGSVRVEDMFAALLLELGRVALGAGACAGYARSGLLTPREARLVALCAVPRDPHSGAGAGAGGAGAVCACGGGARGALALARLPAVLLAPAQALLLAALSSPLPPPPPTDPSATN